MTVKELRDKLSFYRDDLIVVTEIGLCGEIPPVLNLHDVSVSSNYLSYEDKVDREILIYGPHEAAPKSSKPIQVVVLK